MTELSCYIVSYDLCQPDRDYTSLYTALKNYENWGKLTESTWAIVTSKSLIQLRDELLHFMDSNDRLIVIRSGQHAAWSNILANSQWAKENLVK